MMSTAPRRTAMKTVRILAVLALAFAGCGMDIPEVNVAQLHASYSSGDPVVLDVRTTAELDGELGHLDGVINIPVQELSVRLGELQAQRDDTLFVICRSGNRSSSATALLRDSGFNAVNVMGGMNAWRRTFGGRNR